MDPQNNEMEVELSILQQKDRHILANLYPLYLHDLSEYLEMDVDGEGKFDCSPVDLFWKEKNLYPLLIRANHQIAGFILVSGPPYVKPGCDYCIQEFFILKKYRRKGIGMRAANKAFSLFQGKYCLLVISKNEPALHFWRNLHRSNRIAYEEGFTEVEGHQSILHVFTPGQ